MHDELQVHSRTAPVLPSRRKHRLWTWARRSAPSSSVGPYFGAFIVVTRFGATNFSHAFLGESGFSGLKTPNALPSLPSTSEKQGTSVKASPRYIMFSKGTRLFFRSIFSLTA